ncbi:MAG: hypothetical protein ACTSXC_06430 [Candidatus Freyarchaeota archaeon]
MKAVVLVTAAPGKVDQVAKAVRELGVKEVLSVTGRADVVAFLEGSREEILGKVKKIFEIGDVETTETLWEVES